MRIQFEMHCNWLAIIIELPDVILTSINMTESEDWNLQRSIRTGQWRTGQRCYSPMKWPSNYSWSNMLEIIYEERQMRSFILIALTMEDDLKRQDWCSEACSGKGEWGRGYFLIWRVKRWTRSSIEIRSCWDQFNNFGRSLLKILNCQLLYRIICLYIKRCAFLLKRCLIWWY